MADDPFEKLRSLNIPPAAMQGRDQQAVLAGLRKQVGLPEQSQFVRDVLLRQGLGQGVLLGAGDEAEAFARSKLFGTDYDQELAKVRGELAVAKAERPIATTAAEVAGSIAPALGITALTGGAALPAYAAASLPARIGLMARQGALGGVIQGGAEGFLKGEGSAADRLDKAAEGALMGAAIGAPLGAAMPVAGAAFRAVSRTPEQMAAARVQSVMKEAGTTPEDLLRQYQQQQARGVKPEVLGELVSPMSPIVRETERLANAPGSRLMAEGLEQRALQQGQRVEEGFRAAIGQQKNLFDAFDDLANFRMQQAKPLYEASLPGKHVHLKWMNFFWTFIQKKLLFSEVQSAYQNCVTLIRHQSSSAMQTVICLLLATILMQKLMFCRRHWETLGKRLLQVEKLNLEMH